MIKHLQRLIPESWIEQDEHPQHEILSQSHSFYSNGEYDIVIWEGVTEDTKYGSADGHDYAVELLNKETGELICGELFKCESAAEQFAIEYMIKYKHAEHYTIPALDTGMVPVAEKEMFCVDCREFYIPPEEHNGT